MNRNGFMAYCSEEQAKAVLRYAHEKGMEGHLKKLTQKIGPEELGEYFEMPEETLYGVQFIWPDNWKPKQVRQFFEEMHHDLRFD